MQQTGDAQPSERGTCGDLRTAAETACAGVPALRAAALVAADALARARASLFDAETRMAAAQDAADPRVIAEAKAQAQRTYRRGYTASANTHDRRRVATAWMRELDRLNRDARMAKAAFDKARRGVNDATLAVEAALRTAYTERIRAESAADACQTARARLAECEERDTMPARPAIEPPPTMMPAWVTAPTDPQSQSQSPAAAQPQSPPQPVERPMQPVQPAPPSPAPVVPAAPAPAAIAPEPPLAYGHGPESAPLVRHPLVIQRLLGGDREVLRAVSADIAEATGRDATTFMLLLQELVEALAGTAADAGYLEFDRHDPFWGQFSREEARAIVLALASMGFRYDAREGWLGGRSPGTTEFSLALSQIGFDVRSARLPVGTGMAELFSGAHLAADEQLASRAPSLQLDQMLALLGHRADGLGELWDDWGRLRPLLLAESPD